MSEISSLHIQTIIKETACSAEQAVTDVKILVEELGRVLLSLRDTEEVDRIGRKLQLGAYLLSELVADIRYQHERREK